jgi:hypothetical protein
MNKTASKLPPNTVRPWFYSTLVQEIGGEDFMGDKELTVLG